MGDLYVQEGGVWHITGGLERLIGHAHVEPDEKRGITASEQAVPPDRREKAPASR